MNTFTFGFLTFFCFFLGSIAITHPLFSFRETANKIPTVHPAENFNATVDAKLLKDALEGVGTDEDVVIDLLARRGNAQRVEIAEEYRKLYGKTLRNTLKKELSGQFRDTMLSLILPTPLFYAMELNRAITGLGTNEDLLIEILCTLDKTELKAVSAAYEKRYEPLVEDIELETSGDYQNFLVSLLESSRDTSDVTDSEQAKIDARTLYEAGVNRPGTDEDAFIDIFTTRNFNQLRLIFDEYKYLAFHRMEYAIKEEFSGDIKDALLSFVKRVRNLHGYLATHLFDSMDGAATQDDTLIRIIVTRSELDLADIIREYKSIYKRDLVQDVKDDTSGDYRSTLVALLGSK